MCGEVVESCPGFCKENARPSLVQAVGFRPKNQQNLAPVLYIRQTVPTRTSHWESQPQVIRGSSTAVAPVRMEAFPSRDPLEKEEKIPVPAMAIAACLEHGLDHSEVTARSGGGDRAFGFELPLELLEILCTHGGGHLLAAAFLTS